MKIRLLSLLLLTVFISSSFIQTANAALSEEQRRQYSKNVLYYDIQSCSDVGASADDSGEIDGSGSEGAAGVYSSGLKAPFILEQWAIHTLKAIAQKRGVDESNVVTKEHVIALLAFAIGEGGDINNTSSVFNPLNTGLNAPELINGRAAGNGTQAFNSFDAGVEATARTMVGSNQNRLAKVLTEKDSTAAEFMNALTYFKKYKGNKLWAEASTPDPEGYYQGRLSIVKQVRSNYKDLASIVMGTQELEQPAGKRDPSKLTFDGSTDATGDIDGTVSADGGCKCSSPSTDTGHSTLTGSDNAEKAFKYLTGDKKLTAVQAAGIVGNFMQESGVNLDTKASNGSHTGIAQWDNGNRWPALLRFAAAQDGDKSPYSLMVQLDFALQEAPMKEYLKLDLKSVSDAATQFERLFERSGGSALDKRVGYAEDIHGKYKDSVPSDGGADALCAGAGGNGNAFVDGDYAWPVELNKSEVNAGWPLPCNQASCHHDRTPAFDLAHNDTVKGSGADDKSAGRATYAITDGQIEKVGIYMGIEGCYSLQFKSSKDGFVYWYGHLRKPVTMKVGQKFKAGEKIAEIGERKCTGNGSYPHLHIDRGSPKGSFGGSPSSRDAGMIDVINKLYNKLP